MMGGRGAKSSSGLNVWPARVDQMSYSCYSSSSFQCQRDKSAILPFLEWRIVICVEQQNQRHTWHKSTPQVRPLLLYIV